jgi:hypothetical protein
VDTAPQVSSEGTCIITSIRHQLRAAAGSTACRSGPCPHACQQFCADGALVLLSRRKDLRKGCLGRRTPGSFAEKPLQERPRASQPLFCSRRGSGGPEVCRVYKPSIEIHQPLRIQPDLQPLRDAVEGAVVRPDTVPVVRALPGIVTLRTPSRCFRTARLEVAVGNRGSSKPLGLKG